MSDIRLADVSEFQTVDWPAYTEPAVIIRALYGTSHVDHHWATNIAAARARAGLRVRGIYQYVVASQDIAAQAHAFVALVGRLLPGEFAIADIEEGGGDLQGRFETWAQIVHASCGGVEGEYSGVSFARAHLEDFAGAPLVWVAAYQANEPTDHHQLWQYTDRQSFAGISAPCDASVFHGSIDQLYALVTGAPVPAPAPKPLPPPAPPGKPTVYPEDHMQSTPIQVQIRNGEGWCASPVPAAKVVNCVAQDISPAAAGRYVPVPWFRGVSTDANGGQALEFGPGPNETDAIPDGNYGFYVWSVTE